MNNIKCIHKPIKGGCTQINPRYGRPYARYIQATCLGNPANTNTIKPIKLEMGIVTEEAEAKMWATFREVWKKEKDNSL